MVGALPQPADMPGVMLAPPPLDVPPAGPPAALLPPEDEPPPPIPVPPVLFMPPAVFIPATPEPATPVGTVPPVPVVGVPPVVIVTEPEVPEPAWLALPPPAWPGIVGSSGATEHPAKDAAAQAAPRPTKKNECARTIVKFLLLRGRGLKTAFDNEFMVARRSARKGKVAARARNRRRIARRIGLQIRHEEKIVVELLELRLTRDLYSGIAGRKQSE